MRYNEPNNGLLLRKLNNPNSLEINPQRQHWRVCVRVCASALTPLGGSGLVTCVDAAP